jgi:hypothetical protein
MLLYHEDKRNKILRNVRNLCVYYAAWHNIPEDLTAQQRPLNSRVPNPAFCLLSS